MATAVFPLLPWTGGLNDSVDPGMLPSNDLVTADNVLFATSGSRLKRSGIEYLDTGLPAVIKRSSSGTTRTLVFASTLHITSPANDELLVVGEGFTFSSTNATEQTNYGGTWRVATLATTTVANDTLTFTAGSSLTEALTATSTATVKRADTYIGLKDS